ncbi:hypothetical protein ACLOJK_017050 [Asimina triloba]
MLALVLGLLLGAAAVLVAEALLLLLLLDRLTRKSKQQEAFAAQAGRELDAEESVSLCFNKQVSPKESSSKATKEQKGKKEIVEVFPVKKFARIKDHVLILIENGSSQTIINLVGCVIVAVSASVLSSKKWAKRYPIKIESKKSVIYNGSRACYIYLETSWEKESWCKALRLASCVDKERINSHVKLNAEFYNYLVSLNEEYPSFMKSTTGLGEMEKRDIAFDGSSSKVQLFLKKLAKKASKSGIECKTGRVLSLGRDERKTSERLRSHQDRLASTSVNSASSDKIANNLSEDDMVPTVPSLNHSDSVGQVSALSAGDQDEKFGNDEGTLCCNLLFSRMFFDAKRSPDINKFLHSRVQRALSNLRTPSYIGGITCTNLDIGNFPPHIHSMRLLPIDVNEVWAMEADIEYSGGAILYVETRLEVREPDFQKGIVNMSMEEGAGREVSSDLLEGIKQYGNQIHSKDTADTVEKRDEGDKLGVDSSHMLHHLHVPLSLAIRVTSLRGTLRLYIKPPPSDQLWFGFTSMPDIGWDLDSSLGDHKITNVHVAMLISSRFKAAIRESIVLPNCENICIPWMISEKEDWIPWKDAPFIWARQETSETIVCDPPSSLTEPISQSTSSSESVTTRLISSGQPINGKSMEELRTPLLQGSDTQESGGMSASDSQHCTSRSTAAARGEEQSFINDDSKPKRAWRRAKMMDLGKKMGEKLEEKRRHIEEKGRNIVEKMRGQGQEHS